MLDLATGSGLCALAALRAGAAHVQGVDVDPVAVAAAAPQRRAQRRRAASCSSATCSTSRSPPDVDVVLAGDVFYDAAMAERVQPWLLDAHRAGARGCCSATRAATTCRGRCSPSWRRTTWRRRATLEGVLVKTTRVYAFGA